MKCLFLLAGVVLASAGMMLWMRSMALRILRVMRAFFGRA
jgi:hypothetical protein